jgi:DNA/RNA endonuclease YhcR with UshA esterase domain
VNERTLLKISITITIIGLSFLFLYSEEIDLREIASIDTQLPEEIVTMQGIVQKVQPSDKVLFMNVAGQRTENVDVILFTEENIYVKKGDSVEISGTVEEYKGKKEIIANKIRLK